MNIADQERNKFGLIDGKICIKPTLSLGGDDIETGNINDLESQKYQGDTVRMVTAI